MRLAVFFLNMDDSQLEERMRGMPEQEREATLKVLEVLDDIRERNQAAVDICRDATARLLVILDRLYRSPDDSIGR